VAFNFSRISESDLRLLHEWLSRPHIAEQWGEPVAAASMRTKFMEHMSSDIVFSYLAKLEGIPVGYVQTYDATKVGGGWWPNFESHSARQLIADPSLANPRAIRCFEKSWFKAVGEVRTPDGPALLMQMPS
jgi:RimJ/RimL family protein N-acetyltransferase